MKRVSARDRVFLSQIVNEFLLRVLSMGKAAGLTEKDKDWDELEYWAVGGGSGSFTPPPSDVLQESSLACMTAAKVLQKIANLEGEARKIKSVRMSEIRKEEDRQLQEEHRARMAEIDRLTSRIMGK